MSTPQAITNERLEDLDRYFRAANYLSVGQIYLKDNSLLEVPLEKDHIKKRLLGHFGTSPGLNLIYAHLNRLIQDVDAEVLYITGPGHGGPAIRANVFLEGVMTEVYPEIGMNTQGIHKLMREFSWPGGVPSHVSPPTPGSIHEGGELGYSLVHAVGAALDHPDLLVACVVGDGEAETGPLAASWQGNKFLNPKRDGAVLPILHLNGYKISGPTLLGRMEDEELKEYFEGLGYQPFFVEGDEPDKVHRTFWEVLNECYLKIQEIKENWKPPGIPEWPVMILRTPKGWTGPKVVDGKQVEGTFRSHQVPISDVIENDEHFHILEEWLRSYRPQELFDVKGKPFPEVLKIVPKNELRMGASPYANGGKILQDLDLPEYSNYAIDVPAPGAVTGEATRNLGIYVRDIFTKNPHNFCLFCPDETNSNRFNHVFEVTKRRYLNAVLESDDDLGPEGRVMEVLSEHLCQGWLEGYLLSGRHGFFPCYEAFAMIVDSMLNQHGKWLKACLEIPWRVPIASLNYLLTSHAWRQDHNGFSHQGPGFIESVLQKKSSVARMYFPPDGNCLLSVTDHCLRSRNYVNLIIAGKQPMPQWLNMEEAKAHCAKGLSRWEWASTPGKPDIVFGCAGDTPTFEILAATQMLREAFPSIVIHVVNVVDIFTLMPPHQHPHGLDQKSFTELFPLDVPILFAFHGHPRVIHELTYHRPQHDQLSVRGYIEEGTTTTPFDMVVCNKMSRFHLMQKALHSIPRLKSEAGDFIAHCDQELSKHKTYIFEHGVDMDEITSWKWQS